MNRTLRIFSLAAVLFAGAAGAADKFSDAEVLLFETDHLKPITAPTALHYAFKKEGTLEPGFQDRVEIDVERVMPDGGKQVSTQYFTGEHRKEFPPIEEAFGNPVLLYFLERDIREMERLTGGKPFYFQKRIRMALAERAEVRPVRFAFNGKEIAGTEVKVTPYRDDPLRSRFEKYAGKYYLFTFSDQLPGGVYEIRAVIPGSKGTLLGETLTFVKSDQMAKAGK